MNRVVAVSLIAVLSAVLLLILGGGLLYGQRNTAQMKCMEMTSAAGGSEFSSWYDIGSLPPHWICKTDRGTYDMGLWPRLDNEPPPLPSTDPGDSAH